MKNYVIGGLTCLLIALVVGVEPVQRLINETVNRGTLRGVETCISYSSSSLLSTNAVKATCVAAFQKPLYKRDHATGRAGPRFDEETVSWEGVLENKTPDHVTTSVRFLVKVFDENGAEQEFFAETSIWIDPVSETGFKVELPDAKSEQFDDTDFCNHDESAPKVCISWNIVEIEGLTI